MCFLRLSPSEEKSFSSVAAEIHLIKWLNEKGFSAMKPVAMKTGEFAKEMCTEWGTFNVSCFAKVPGNSLEDTKGSLSIIRGYGQILGKLHSLMKDYPCSEKHRSHEDLLKEIGNRIKEYDAIFLSNIYEFGDVNTSVYKSLRTKDILKSASIILTPHNLL